MTVYKNVQRTIEFDVCACIKSGLEGGLNESVLKFIQPKRFAQASVIPNDFVADIKGVEVILVVLKDFGNMSLDGLGKLGAIEALYPLRHLLMPVEWMLRIERKSIHRQLWWICCLYSPHASMTSHLHFIRLRKLHYRISGEWWRRWGTLIINSESLRNFTQINQPNQREILRFIKCKHSRSFFSRVPFHGYEKVMERTHSRCSATFVLISYTYERIDFDFIKNKFKWEGLTVCRSDELKMFGDNVYIFLIGKVLVIERGSWVDTTRTNRRRITGGGAVRFLKAGRSTLRSGTTNGLVVRLRASRIIVCVIANSTSSSFDARKKQAAWYAQKG